MLDGLRFGQLANVWPRQAAGRVEDFVAQLYRRGLLTIEGQSAVDRRMFADGPNYNEGHLVELLLTEKCNLACPYCLAGASQAMPAMDAPLARRAVDLAYAMNEAEIIAFEFAGGEPLLKFDLMRELVTYIENHPARRGRRLFLSLQTNATLLNDERAAWLAGSGIQVGISLDGGAQAQNRGRPMVNGKPSHGALMRGIELLQKHGVSFGALVVLNRHNIGDPEGLARFLLEHRIHGFRLQPRRLSRRCAAKLGRGRARADRRAGLLPHPDADDDRASLAVAGGQSAHHVQLPDQQAAPHPLQPRRMRRRRQLSGGARPTATSIHAGARPSRPG